MDLSLEIRKDPNNAAALKAKMLEKLSESERYNLLIYEMIVLGQIERISNHYDFSNSNLSGNNFGTQTNASLNLLSQTGAEEKKIAGILTEVSKAVAGDAKLSFDQKREAVDHVSHLAEEAQRPIDQRNQALVSAALEAIPKILSSGVSLMTLWHNFGPYLSAFFH